MNISHAEPFWSAAARSPREHLAWGAVDTAFSTPLRSGYCRSLSYLFALAGDPAESRARHRVDLSSRPECRDDRCGCRRYRRESPGDLRAVPLVIRRRDDPVAIHGRRRAVPRRPVSRHVDHREYLECLRALHVDQRATLAAPICRCASERLLWPPKRKLKTPTNQYVTESFSFFSSS